MYLEVDHPSVPQEEPPIPMQTTRGSWLKRNIMHQRSLFLLPGILLVVFLVGAGFYLRSIHKQSTSVPVPPEQPQASAPTLVVAPPAGVTATQLTILRPIVVSSSSYVPPARMLAPWETIPIAPSPRSLAANLPAPTLMDPPDGAQLTSLSATLSWTNPQGTTQYHLQVIPWNNDGPGVDLIVGDSALVSKASYTIPAPVFGQGPYIMLPGATYTWKVQVSDATASIAPDDASWSEWSATRTFTTPRPDSITIDLVEPRDLSTVHSATPTLRWIDRNPQMFYYEVKLSPDPLFGETPRGPVAPVYWNLVHGAITSPLNSWTVPPSAALQPGTYYWRIRHRVQATPQGSAERGTDWTSMIYEFTVE